MGGHVSYCLELEVRLDPIADSVGEDWHYQYWWSLFQVMFKVLLLTSYHRRLAFRSLISVLFLFIMS